MKMLPALCMFLLVGCSDTTAEKANDLDERLSYAKRLAVATLHGDDGQGCSQDRLISMIWDKWRLSPQEFVNSIGDKRADELDAFIDNLIKKNRERILSNLPEPPKIK